MQRSLWSDTAALDVPPPLDRDVDADVCVIGAGIAGLSVAWSCAADGRSVVVLDDDPLVAGETARTTAHLVTALDAGWARLLWVHGEAAARLAAASHAAAIDRIETIARSEDIACDFRRLDGYLFAARGTPPERLREELAAARQAGVAGVELVLRPPLPGPVPGPALRFPRQADLHPLRYLAGLQAAVIRRGVRCYGHTHATAIDGAGPARVRTSHGPAVRAAHVVVATNTPVTYTVALHTKQAAWRTYVVAGPVPRGTLPAALFWDTADPFHYLRTVPGDAHDLLVVGGEDHRTGQEDGDPAARWDRLAAWARERVPALGAITWRWSGQIMASMDGLAFMGRTEVRPDVYVVTGDSGNGMTHGTIAGTLIADLIAGRENPWAAVYDPARVRVRAVGEFARENLNVATQYAAWVERAPAGGTRPTQGTGVVVRRGLQRVAVHRDAAGRVVECSAVCPHLKCIVAWNAAEGTWDCPCHGSRFDPHGRVIHGPANRDLDPVPPPEAPHVEA